MPNEIRTRLEEFNLDESQIDEVIGLLEEQKKSEKELSHIPIADQEVFLKQKLMETKDPRKRARIAAQIISLNLG